MKSGHTQKTQTKPVLKRMIVETVLATLLVPGVAIFAIPYIILRWTGTGWPSSLGLLQATSFGFGLIGMGMVIWVSFSFVTKGRGTPIPLDPPAEFVASGLFRFVRNPMYVGVTLTLLSEALFFGSGGILIFAGLLWLTLHLFLLLIEEPQLKARFGESYQGYLESTPRWVPRIPDRKDRAL